MQNLKFTIVAAVCFAGTLSFNADSEAQIMRRFSSRQSPTMQRSIGQPAFAQRSFAQRSFNQQSPANAGQRGGLFNATPEQKKRRRTLLLAMAAGAAGFADATAGFDWGASANNNSLNSGSTFRSNHLQSQRAAFNRGYSTNLDHAPVTWSRF